MLLLFLYLKLLTQKTDEGVHDVSIPIFNMPAADNKNALSRKLPY